jgi:mitochondrial fission protein ELM1
MTKKAWILDDKRAGNKTQTTALAESLKLDYEIKKIEYNCLAKLPNILLFGLMHIDKEKSDDLITCKIPDVIISAGRRCALVAAYLKKKVWQ